ncbi:MAG: recombinase family protein [Clostridia bacterium]|nr:recombinase family protein [Clostridia bacterium]
MTKKACAYIRVSDERQDEYSPDSQRKRIIAFAQQHSMMLCPEDFFYDDGISAKTAANRTAFQQMIARARRADHPYDVILVWKFSRFARNQEEAIVYKNLLRKTGVEVVSVSEPLTDDPFGALIERIIEWMDEYYITNLSAEVRRGMTEKAERGEAMGQAVFGYDRTTKSYVPNADAPQVLELFRAFAGGAQAAELAEGLASSGVRTGRGTIPTARWVRYLLQNPVYMGQVRWKSADGTVTVAQAHPAIVPPELYEAVQVRLRTAPRTRVISGEADLLAGLVYCSACGGPLVRAGANPPTMQCGRYARGRCSVSHSISRKKLVQAVFDGLRPVLEPVPACVGTENVVSYWQKRMKQTDDRLRRAAAAYQNGVDTLAEYRAVKERLEAERAEYGARAAAVPAFGENLWTQLQSEALPVMYRRMLLQAVAVRMVYHRREERLDIYLNGPGQEMTDDPADRTASWGHPCGI